MAGKPPAPPRAAQRSSAHETSVDSRAAAASEWETPPVRAGVRREVKLAVLLIVTLSGVFGYLVHRKFDALRQQAAAAEGAEPEKFVPLAKAAKVAGEIDLSPPPQAEPDEPAFAPGSPSTIAQASGTTPASASTPPPLLPWASPDAHSESNPAPSQERQNPPVAAGSAGSPPRQAEPTSPREAVDSELLGLLGRGEGESTGRGVAPRPTPEANSTPAMTAGDRGGSSVPTGDGPLSEEPLAFPEHLPAAHASGAGTNLSSTAPLPVKVPDSTAPTTPQPVDRESGWAPRQEGADIAAGSAATPPPQREEPFDPAFGPAPFEPAERPTLPTAATAPTGPPSISSPVAESPGQNVEPLPFSGASRPPRTVVDPQPRPAERTSPDGDPFQLFAPATPPAAAADVPAGDLAPSPPLGATSQSSPPIFPETVADPFPRPASSEPSAPGPRAPPPLASEGTGLDSAAASPRHRLLDEIDTSPRPGAAPDPFPEVRPQPIPQGTLEPTASTERAFGREGSQNFGDSRPASGPHPPADRGALWGNRPTSAPLYTVRPGDSYWTISRIQYGSGRYHAALREFNRASLPEAERIHPGMQLQIPPVDLLESRYPELVQGAPAPVASSPAASPLVEDEAGRFFISAEGQPMYRVGKGDTLTSIAQRHLGRASRWEQIARMNPDVVPHPDRLKVGVTLRLPPDASQVAASPAP